jgi:hypothetical protein
VLLKDFACSWKLWIPILYNYALKIFYYVQIGGFGWPVQRPNVGLCSQSILNYSRLMHSRIILNKIHTRYSKKCFCYKWHHHIRLDNMLMYSSSFMCGVVRTNGPGPCEVIHPQNDNVMQPLRSRKSTLSSSYLVSLVLHSVTRLDSSIENTFSSEKIVLEQKQSLTQQHKHQRMAFALEG